MPWNEKQVSYQLTKSVIPAIKIPAFFWRTGLTDLLVDRAYAGSLAQGLRVAIYRQRLAGDAARGLAAGKQHGVAHVLCRDHAPQ